MEQLKWTVNKNSLKEIMNSKKSVKNKQLKVVSEKKKKIDQSSEIKNPQ